MTRLISTELGPNFEFDDALTSKLTLLLGSLIDRNAELKSKNWFRNFLNLNSNHPLYFTDNGRTSLYLLLKSLNLEADSEVLIQGFSCVVLPNSVWGAGLKPVLVDCDKKDFNFNLQDLQNKITKKTKVLIVQYTFGVVPEMDKIVDFCKTHDLILIEDVAHSLGCKAIINNKEYKIGTIGHGAFFSFGRDKIISTTRGGFGYINPNPIFNLKNTNSSWNKNLVTEYESLSQMKFKNILQTLTYPILTALLIRPFYHLFIGKIILFLARKFSLIGSIYTKSETLGTNKIETASKYPKKLYPLLFNQLKKIDKFNDHRINICKIYSQKLDLPDYNNQPLLRFPVDLKGFYGDNYQSKYTSVIQKLRQNGVLVGQWYTSLFMQPQMDYASKFNLTSQDLPQAFNLSNKRVINLPTNIYVTTKNAELICDILKSLKN